MELNDFSVFEKSEQFANKMQEHGLYEIIAKIGQGGMGAVYKARDIRSNRIVALKILLDTKNKRENERFLSEVRAIVQLDHPYIVKLFESGTKPCYYYTMEYVEGETFKNAMRSLTTKQIVHIISKIADALYHAHRKGFVHRDIKPANILLDKNLEPKIADFGIAKNVRVENELSQTGQIIGTPRYLSPEQIMNRKIDKRCDIFSLGIMMYEALGQYPFEYSEGQICINLFQQIVESAPVPLNQVNKKIPLSLASICHKCIEKNPRNRYANTKYLLQDLQHFLEDKELYARTQNRIAYHFRNYWKTWYLETILALFGLVAAMVYFLPEKNETVTEDFLPELIAKKEHHILERYKQQEKIYAAEIHDYSIKRVWLNKITEQNLQKSSKMRIEESSDKFIAHYMSLYGYFVIENFFDSNILESCEKALELVHQKPETYYTLEKKHKIITFLEIYRHKHYRKRHEAQKEKNEDQINRMAKRIQKIEDILMKEYLGIRIKKWKSFAENANINRHIKKNNLKPRMNAISTLLEKKIGFDNWKVLWDKLFSFAQELKSRNMRFSKFDELFQYFAEINGRISAGYNPSSENELSYFYKFESNNSYWEKEKNLLSAISFSDQSIFYQKLVDFYEKFDLHDEIISLCTKGLQLNSSECSLHYHMAKTKIYLGDYDSAQQHLNFMVTNYAGNRMDMVYVQQARLYILTNKYELAEKYLAKAKHFVLDYKELIHEVLLWQYVFFTLQNQTTKASDIWNEFRSYQNQSAQNKVEVRYISTQMKIYRELKMFDKAYPLWNSELNDFEAQKEKLLINLAELESLKWEIGVPYVAELWEKTYIEVLNELKKNAHHTETLWYRKIVQLLVNCKGNERIQETIRDHIPTDMKNAKMKYFNFHSFYRRFLSEDVFRYYIVDKLAADMEYTEAIYVSASQTYENVFQNVPWFKKSILQRDINLAYCFYYNYMHSSKQEKYEVFSVQITKNILKRHPNYSPAYTLLGKYYRNFNSMEAVKYYQKVDENALSPRERKSFNHDFAELYLREGKYDKALEKFNTWRLLEPSHPFGYLYPGMCYLEMKKYQEALDCFTNLVNKDTEKANPNRKKDVINSYQHRAGLYAKWGDSINDRAKKKECYQNALKDWNSVVPWNSSTSGQKQKSIRDITQKIKALGK